LAIGDRKKEKRNLFATVQDVSTGSFFGFTGPTKMTAKKQLVILENFTE
jgi:hypothetical protein